MMKTIKGKVITGAAVFAVLTGGAAAFASTDAGANLKSWYDGQFNKSATNVVENSVDYASDQVPGLAKEYNGLKKDATRSINNTKNSEIDDANSEINDTKDQYIAALNGSKEEINKYLKSQFDGIVQNAHTTIGVVGGQAYDYAETELSGLTLKNGNSALADLEAKLKKSNEDAVAELELAIANAKSELQAELDSQEGASTQRIKDAIDAKIWELRGKITERKDVLVSEQQTLIVEKSQKLEDDAKAALDTVVSNIN